MKMNEKEWNVIKDAILHFIDSDDGWPLDATVSTNKPLVRLINNKKIDFLYIEGNEIFLNEEITPNLELMCRYYKEERDELRYHYDCLLEELQGTLDKY